MLKVTHFFYHSSASEFLYQVDVTIGNLTGRAGGAGPTDLLASTNDGFETSTPLAFQTAFSGHRCIPESRSDYASPGRVLYRLGVSHGQKGNRREAVAALKKTLEIQRDFPYAAEARKQLEKLSGG